MTFRCCVAVAVVQCRWHAGFILMLRLCFRVVFHVDAALMLCWCYVDVMLVPRLCRCYAMSMLCWFHLDVTIALSCCASCWRYFDLMLTPCWCHDFVVLGILMLLCWCQFDIALMLHWGYADLTLLWCHVKFLSGLRRCYVGVLLKSFFVVYASVLFMLPRCYSDASLRVLRYWFEPILWLFHVTLGLRRGYFELVLVLTSGWCLTLMVFWDCCEVILRLLQRYFHAIWDAMLVLLYC